MTEGTAECAHIHRNLLPGWTEGSHVLKQFSHSWQKWTLVWPQNLKKKRIFSFCKMWRSPWCTANTYRLKPGSSKGSAQRARGGGWGHLFICQTPVIILWEMGDVSGVIESAVVAAATRCLSFVARCCADIGAARYLWLARRFQPLIYIPYEFRRLRGSASRSCRTEGVQNTLPIWKPRAALGIFCVQTTWKARFLGPFTVYGLYTHTRPQITQSCNFNYKLKKTPWEKKKQIW